MGRTRSRALCRRQVILVCEQIDLSDLNWTRLSVLDCERLPPPPEPALATGGNARRKTRPTSDSSLWTSCVLAGDDHQQRDHASSPAWGWTLEFRVHQAPGEPGEGPPWLSRVAEAGLSALGRISHRPRVRVLNGSGDVYEFYQGFADLDREVLYATHVDQRRQAVGCEEVEPRDPLPLGGPCPRGGRGRDPEPCCRNHWRRPPLQHAGRGGRRGPSTLILEDSSSGPPCSSATRHLTLACCRDRFFEYIVDIPSNRRQSPMQTGNSGGAPM
jgi:hypothetical protein